MTPIPNFTVSPSGWQRIEEIRHGAPSGRVAFMAMAFGKENIDRAYRECFKPACSAAGFDLVRIDEKPRAGLIDDTIRVAIRRSHFVIADLTDRNPGAYWEAGFAHGLGKPVIYTCESSFFKEHGTHFDTRNHHTQDWLIDQLAAAQSRLEDTIRATLPGIAKGP